MDRESEKTENHEEEKKNTEKMVNRSNDTRVFGIPEVKRGRVWSRSEV